MRTASLRAFLPALCALSFAACADGTGGTRQDASSFDASPIDAAPECVRNADCEDDGTFCNGTPVCEDGECVEGDPPSCDDSITCTEDTCSAMTDACQNTPMDTRCPDGASCVMGTGCMVLPACEFDTDCADDGVFCNGEPSCIETECVNPERGPCDDGDSCTIDDCAEATERCASTPATYLSDALHCGRTGANDCVVCPGPSAAQVNTVASCEAGSCGVACAPGFGNPDGNLANGCECASGSGTDEPDSSYDDTNCDGIDGDRSRGILVSTSMGNDNATCGLELDRPCRTIAHAMTRAITESRRDLFVMAGTYAEVVVLRDGLRLYGGYDTSWSRGSRAESAHRTVIQGALDMAESQYLTVRAHDLVVAPTLENLILVAPTPSSSSGLSSYVVHVDNTTGLNIIRCTLTQGAGAAGVVGAAGSDATAVVATVDMGGVDGGAADFYISPCDDSTVGLGGRAGTNSCGGGLPVSAGRGGDGGTMDTTCFFVCDAEECDATAGDPGGAAAQLMSGGYGAPGTGGAGTTVCGPGTEGRDGRVQNGGAGAGASSPRGRVVGSYFVGNGGSTGSTGENGGGGGGGGGSGGCDDGFGIVDNSHGAGGGGGGAGGCAARSGGGGGGGGGGSFGVFAIGSSVTIDDCELQRGLGGAGGAGGTGGRGQSGGPGGRAGLAAGTAAPGGRGGVGGHGGHGGGGGGGAGGPSVGVFSLSSTVTATGLLYTGGTAGPAGAGGVSAPGATGPEDDGVDGSAGSAGVLADTFTCASAGGC